MDKLGPNNVMTDGPFDIELRVHIAGEGGERGTANCLLPPGVVPTVESIAKAMAYTLKALPSNLRVMTRHEFMNAKLSEDAGIDMKFGGLGSEAFAVDWSAALGEQGAG